MSTCVFAVSVNTIIMPRCAGEVYGSVRVCLYRLLHSRINEVQIISPTCHFYVIFYSSAMTVHFTHLYFDSKIPRPPPAPRPTRTPRPLPS